MRGVLGAALALAVASGCAPGCGQGAVGDGRSADGPLGDGRPMTADSPELAEVNRVLAARSAELMAIPGVTGVAVGLAEDGRTPCLRVLVESASPALAERIPRTVDGQPVVVDVSGPIRPLDGR